MTREVLIDGVEYVPKSESVNLEIEIIEKVLKGQDILSETSIKNILKAFNEFKTPTESIEPKGYERFIDAEKRLYTSKNLVKIDEKGIMHWHRGRKIGAWTIHHAISIRSKMKSQDSELSKKDILKLSKRIGLIPTTTRRIIYNIEYGEVSNWIDLWISKYGYGTTKKSVPVQNNPEKRREGSW